MPNATWCPFNIFRTSGDVRASYGSHGSKDASYALGVVSCIVGAFGFVVGVVAGAAFDDALEEQDEMARPSRAAAHGAKKSFDQPARVPIKPLAAGFDVGSAHDGV